MIEPSEARRSSPGASSYAIETSVASGSGLKDASETWPSPALGPDGTLYAACHGKKVYAVDSQTGELRWTYETGERMVSSPVVGTDGTAYFLSDKGQLFALDPNGDLLWKTASGPGFTLSSPFAVGPDGTVSGTRPGPWGTRYSPRPIRGMR